jgi:putative hydrolase of the HAD superfamily
VTGVVKACLVDVWQTILSGNFEARIASLTAYAGVDTEVWLAEWLRTAVERDRGNVSVADSVAQALLVCGVEPRPELIADLMRQDAEAMRETVRLYEDTVPFLASLRAQDILIALVSNCADTTRPVLDHLGVFPLVDATILSCEVRSAKPAPEIYLAALDQLGVAAADAVFIDDQHGFCAGAEAVGVRAIQITRHESPGLPAAAPDFPIVSTLLDAPRYF